MSAPVFGTIDQRFNDEPLPTPPVDFAAVALVSTATGADATAFPEYEAVRFNSSNAAKAAKLGTGDLADAVRGINDQLGRAQRAADLIVVRVPEGVSATPAVKLQQTMANVITGLQALKVAPPKINRTPRLVYAGYTDTTYQGLTALAATTAGAGYTPGQSYPLTFSGGGAGAVQATGQAVATDAGAITTATLVIDTPGTYTAAPAVTVAAPGGGGTTAILAATIDNVGNPVVAALPPVLNALLARAIVDLDATSLAASVEQRETIGSERIMPVGIKAKVFDTASATTVIRPMAPRALGLQVRVIHESGGKPFETIANRQIYGIVGTSRDIEFDLRDGASEGQQLLASEIAIVVRGETDVDGAIADGGFVFIGLDNCATDGDLWQQWHQVGGADFIDVEHMRLTRRFLGPKMSADTAEAWINSLKFNLRDHKADDDILGYKVTFEPDQNSPENIRAGRLTVDLGIEEAPAFRVAKRNVRRYRQAVADLVSDMAARINANALS
jgi:hypothetical protein